MKPNPPNQKVADVTGATRGVGKGVALGLAAAASPSTPPGDLRVRRIIGRGIVGVPCDSTNDGDIAQLFDRVTADHGRLDVLVNSAWGGYERMVEDGRFTWPARFWQQPLWRWDAMISGSARGIRGESACRPRDGSRAAGPHRARFPLGGPEVLGNVLYGVSKPATDKLAADMACELTPHGVTVVSMYPGLVRTEAVLAAGVFDLSNSESPEFLGRAVAALSADPDVSRWAGKVVVAAALAQEYGFTDIDGREPRPLTIADI